MDSRGSAITKFEIYRNTKGSFYFRLKAPNGEIMLRSEAYTIKAACLSGIDAVKKYSAIAEVKEL